MIVYPYNIGEGPVYSFLKLLAIGHTESGDALTLENAEEGKPSTPSSPKRTSAEAEGDTFWYCIKLLFCIAGLQVSYLTWGVLQVRKSS